MTVLPSTASIKDHLADFDGLESEWLQLLDRSPRRHIFFTPSWGRCWWNSLGAGELHLLSVRQGDSVVGVLPLVVQDDSVRLLGDKEVCDYLDIVALPGAERVAAESLLRFARDNGRTLDLFPLLPDSTVLEHVAPVARDSGYTVHTEPLDVSYSLPLPASWDEYLDGLHGKNRHELRRKLRRLERSGEVSFYSSQSSPQDLEDFFLLFRTSRASKDEFLTPRRETFFRSLSEELGKQGWLRLYFLELEHKRVATAFCCNFNGTLYLYNSGFEPSYQGISVGLLCKALTIQAAISEGIRVYDFLRGAEDYKSDLGGKPVPVYRCTIITRPGVPDGARREAQ